MYIALHPIQVCKLIHHPFFLPPKDVKFRRASRVESNHRKQGKGSVSTRPASRSSKGITSNSCTQVRLVLIPQPIWLMLKLKEICSLLKTHFLKRIKDCQKEI